MHWLRKEVISFIKCFKRPSTSVIGMPMTWSIRFCLVMIKLDNFTLFLSKLILLQKLTAISICFLILWIISILEWPTEQLIIRNCLLLQKLLNTCLGFLINKINKKLYATYWIIKSPIRLSINRPLNFTIWWTLRINKSLRLCINTFKKYFYLT